MYERNQLMGISRVIAAVRDRVEAVARSRHPVLILGERGTGKNLCAAAIHDAGNRRGRPMVFIDCAALPGTLLESTLFGHERGAFTGAVNRVTGRLEEADGTSLFLDEIGLLSLESQGRLLRFLEEGTIRRIGGKIDMKIETRIIAATNRDLQQAPAERGFMMDLFDRLDVLRINMPPLRDRPEDIPILVEYFLSRLPGGQRPLLADSALRKLAEYAFPGNVRELRSLCNRLETFFPGKTVADQDIEQLIM